MRYCSYYMRFMNGLILCVHVNKGVVIFQISAALLLGIIAIVTCCLLLFNILINKNYDFTYLPQVFL